MAEHMLMQPGKDCDCNERRGSEDFKECPVCEWGASICRICGAAECELLDMQGCPGHRNWRDENGDMKREYYNPK